MRVDRSHAAWTVFVVLATAASGIVYTANFHPGLLPFAVPLPEFLGEAPPRRQTTGGTPLGLIFGVLAYLIFFFASAIGVRKKRRTLPLGPVRLWLRAHLWLSILTLPLVLLHAGFQLGGPHTTWLMLLYAVVMLSGVYGLALQQFMPRMMKERLPREVVFEQIPHVRAQLVDAAFAFRSRLHRLQEEHARDLVEVASAPVRAASADTFYDPSVDILARFYDEHCQPYLAAQRGDRLLLGDARVAAENFRVLKLNVSRQWHQHVDELNDWCERRRLTDLQTRYQHWLHAWLFIHVPISFILLVFTGWHAWISLRFLVTLD